MKQFIMAIQAELVNGDTHTIAWIPANAKTNKFVEVSDPTKTVWTGLNIYPNCQHPFERLAWKEAKQ